MTHENFDQSQLRPACCLIAIVHVCTSPLFTDNVITKLTLLSKNPVNRMPDGMALGEYIGCTPEIARNLTEMLLFWTLQVAPRHM